jgi:uncharacterized membrane protein
MSNRDLQPQARFISLACNCFLAAVVSGLLTAMLLMGIVLLISSYTLAAM